MPEASFSQSNYIHNLRVRSRRVFPFSTDNQVGRTITQPVVEWSGVYVNGESERR